VKKGGFGSAVLEYYASVGIMMPITLLGLPDTFVTHGPVPQLHKDCGIDVDGIVSACRL
jgi:1-deoxy-D-xylulose-5-phosphate synthase